MECPYCNQELAYHDFYGKNLRLDSFNRVKDGFVKEPAIATRKDFNPSAYNVEELDRIKDKPNITFIPDERSIKVQSGNSLVDYLQTKLMFDLHSKTIIENKPQESHYQERFGI